MEKFENFKNIIRKGLLKDFWSSFEILLKGVNENCTLYSELVLIGSRHENIRGMLIDGTIPNGEYIVESNKCLVLKLSCPEISPQ